MKHLKTHALLAALLSLTAPAAFAQHVHEGGGEAKPNATPEAKPSDASSAEKPSTTGSNPLANAVAARTPEEQAAQSGFQFSVGLDHYLGVGTFVNPQIYANFSAMVTVAPTYLFAIGKQKLVASGTFRVAYEYTLPDAETGRRTQVYDTRLGLSAPAFLKESVTGISFSPSLGLVIPTSLESWQSGLITAVSLGVSATRSFLQAIDLRLSVGGSHTFSAFAQNARPAGSVPNDAQGHLTLICRNGEMFCDSTGWNPEWSFSVGGSIAWRATGSIMVSAGLTYMRSWKHAATTVVDQYTAAALDANGNPVAHVGMGQSDRTVATVGISYQMNEHYSLDFGLYTMQSPLTPDGKSVRFPWISFASAADNAATLYLSLTAAY